MVLLSLRFLQQAEEVDEIIVVARPALVGKFRSLIKKEGFSKIKKICHGGLTRYASVVAGVAQSNYRAALFIVHNGVNPLASHAELTACVKAVRGTIAGAAVGRPLYNTLKKVSGSRVVATIDRSGAWAMETPQVVRAKEFRALTKKFPPPTHAFIDELAVLEKARFKAAVVVASDENHKVTTQNDLAFISMLAGALPPDWSVGIGEDSHRFMTLPLTTKPLILGGIVVPEIPALRANSDGDVLLHALCNAISSALGAGSLGTYATALHRKGEKKSTAYLANVLARMKRARHTLQHIAISFEAAVPKIDPLVPRLKKNLTKLLGVSEARVGITATSGEGLTAFGRGEGIACRAIVLLKKTA